MTERSRFTFWSQCPRFAIVPRNEQQHNELESRHEPSLAISPLRHLRAALAAPRRRNPRRLQGDAQINIGVAVRRPMWFTRGLMWRGARFFASAA